MMTKLNFYLAFIALLTAVSVLNFIPIDFKELIETMFFITCFGFVLQMILENFDFKIDKIKTYIIKLEGWVFYIITWLMIVYIQTTLVFKFIEITKMKINVNIIFSVFGLLGAYLASFTKKKPNKNY